MLHVIYTSLLKLLQQELAMSTAPDPEATLVVQPARSAAARARNTNVEAAAVAGIDANANELHMSNGMIYQITRYQDPYGKECEPEDACCVEAFNGSAKIKVEFYSTRYTRH